MTRLTMKQAMLPLCGMTMITLSACADMSTTQQRTLTGGAGGAAAGAALGAIGGNAGLGAAAGAGAGLLGGYLYDQSKRPQ